MPALKLRGKALISAIRTKTHIGVYPFSSAAVAAVAGAVAGIPGVEASTGAIRIDPGTEPRSPHPRSQSLPDLGDRGSLISR